MAVDGAALFLGERGGISGFFGTSLRQSGRQAARSSALRFASVDDSNEKSHHSHFFPNSAKGGEKVS
jgi:hypothetical protein